MESHVECHENGKEYAKMKAKIRTRRRRMQIDRNGKTGLYKNLWAKQMMRQRNENFFFSWLDSPRAPRTAHF